MKYLKYILILVALVGILSPTPETVAQTSSSYQLLAPLPSPEGGELKDFNPEEGVSKYLNLMIKMFIGFCAVLSIVMIVAGGMEYMTSELIHSKEAGKERIKNAILGLIIALGAYALLFTINPDLLKSDFNPKKEKIIVELPKEGDCVVRVRGVETTIRATKINCEENPNSQSWNGTLTRFAVKDCVVRASGANTTIQATKVNCETNPNAQSWNGTATSTVWGECTFRRAQDLTQTTAQTTKENCELHGSRYISWTPAI